MVFVAPIDAPSKDEYPELYHIANKYPFQLSSWQLWTILSLLQGNNALTCAPTGSGKTLAAEWAIEHFVSKGKKVIYTSPIKALSNYMKSDFEAKFPNISFGIITGDNKDNPDADCIICTTECLRNYLFTSDEDAKSTTLDFNMNINDDVGIIIYDEAHYFNDKDRGGVWEECYIKQPNNVQMLLMSATLHNPHKFAEWLESASSSKVCLAETHDRAVPLEHKMFFTCHQSYEKKLKDKKLIQNIQSILDNPVTIKDSDYNELNYHKINNIMRELSKNKVYIKRNFVLNKVVEFLKHNDKLPAILFVYSRKGVELFAKEIVHNLHSDPTYPNIVSKVAGDILRDKLPNADEYMSLPEYSQIIKLLEKGIGIHHGGMLPVFRELIEKIFKAGFIQLLVATETFAVGINLPCKCTLFPRLVKWDGTKNRLLQGHEYIQQAGRAGRRGFDTLGEAYLLVNLFTDMPYSNEYKEMLSGKPQALSSKFKISYEFVLNVIETGLINNEQSDIIGFAKNSMILHEINKELEYINKDILDNESSLKTKKDSLQYCSTSKDLINEYLSGLEQLPFTKKKQRKTLERRLENIKESNKMFNKDLELYESIIKLEKFIDNLHKQHHNTGEYIRYNVESVFNILKDREFINKNELKLTETGIIAHNIKEIHSLAIADTMNYCSYFENFTPSEIAAYLSIYTCLNVKDEYKIYNPNSNNDNLNDIIKFTKERINAYEDIENKYEIFTNTPNEINYDLINSIQKWCETDTLEGCKKILYDTMYNSEIFVGDFVKAILKINNIVNELDRLCDLLTNKVDLQNKIRQIPKMTLKFIATNQSLYI